MTSLLRQLHATGRFTCLLLSGCRTSPVDPKAVEQQFALAISLHSTQAQVIEYLDSQKLPHSKYHHDSTNDNVIESAATMKTPQTWIGRDYHALFLFDDSGYLLKYNVDYLGFIGL